MPLQPIVWGPPQQADQEGLRVAQQATAQHEQVFAEARQLGENVQNGAVQITQGLLHNQALKATAQVKEQQAAVLSFIDSNPYVSKSALQQRMAPDDYQSWHEGLGKEYQDRDAVPMFTAAGALFDSSAKQARAEAGQTIGLPGWRSNWLASEQTESATIRERYVNRMAADQMVADQRSSAMLSIDKIVDNATAPNDFDTALTAAKTNPWFRPAERRILQEKVGVAKDSFPAEQAMLSKDPQLMQNELVKLRSDNSAELYPNLNEKQRVDLSQRLERQFAYHGSKDLADQIVNRNTDERGKVNDVALGKELKDYNGPDREGVIAAAKSQAAEQRNIFDAGTSEVQDQINTAGLDPRTGEFSYQRARADPATAKLMDQLQKDAPKKLEALNAIDARRMQRLEIADRREAVDAERKEATRQKGELDKYRLWMDDEGQRNFLMKLSPSQWDSYLLDSGMTGPYLEAGRKEFAAYQKAGGPDQRVKEVITSEINSAANGSAVKSKKLTAKYGDALSTAANAFIRTNKGLPPDQMTDALKTYVKSEMIRGAVINGGSFVGDANDVPKIDWETNPKYRGLDFRGPDGQVVSGKEQRVRLSRGGVTMDFTATNAEAARADGWK